MCYNLIRVLLRRGLKVLASIAGGRGKTMGVRDFNLRNSIVRKNGEDSFEPVLNVHTPLSSTLTPNFYVPLYKSLAKRKFFLGKKKKKVRVGQVSPTCPSKLPLCLRTQVACWPRDAYHCFRSSYFRFLCVLLSQTLTACFFGQPTNI